MARPSAWGRLVFEFDDDFTAFTGKWSNNNDEPTVVIPYWRTLTR